MRDFANGVDNEVWMSHVDVVRACARFNEGTVGASFAQLPLPGDPLVTKGGTRQNRERKFAERWVRCTSRGVVFDDDHVNLVLMF